MTDLIQLARYILIIAIAAIISTYAMPLIAPIYRAIIAPSAGSFADLDFAGVALIIYTFEFLLPIFAYLFGDKSRYKFFAGIFIVSLLICLPLDRGNVAIWVTALILGTILGWIIRFIVSNSLGKIAQFQSWKKYF
jgi:hypothetical protein